MKFSTKVLFCCAVCAAGLAGSSPAADMFTTSTVGNNTGWNTPNIWMTNGTTTTVTGVFPGNTYEVRSNGIPFGWNLGNARMRNLYASTSPLFQTFPGDSLTMNTNTEFRFKRISNGVNPTVNFPGVGGNAGLFLKGGVLNVGDDYEVPLAGKIEAVAGTLSLICPGDNGAGPTLKNSRVFNIMADLSGSGTLYLMQSPAVNPHRLTGNANTFSGQWIVKAGWLQGVGLNSLGTGNILLDPDAAVPLDPDVVLTNTFAAGPAILEPMYDHNSPGTLTINGTGQVRLHQNCAFTAVTIGGVPLSPGRHYYSELAANFAANFPVGGSGAITVQPYGPLPIVFGIQPLPQMVYAGRTAHFNVTASGPGTITYQWRKNTSNLSDGGNISGATSPNLVVSSVSGTDQATYDVVISNGTDSTTSQAVSLTVITPSGEGYETAVLAASPAVYYRLNETGEPATRPFAFDYVGGGVGNYGIGSMNGSPTFNIAGPTPGVGFTGFGAANKAAQFANLTADSRVTMAPWNFNTNIITITAWINPSVIGQAANEGLVFCRGGGTVAGLNYSGVTDALGNRTLGYTWNNEWETYNWDSGIAPPGGQWSFVALVVTPTAATIYVMNTAGMLESTHTYTHVPQSFAGTTLIGDDSQSATGARAFTGSIDDVAVFTSDLSKAQLTTLYAAGLGTTPNYAPQIVMQPTSTNYYAGQTAMFRVVGGGTEPLTYQWKKGAIGSGIYANITDGGRFSGATTATLLISNIADADALDYVVTLTNPNGSVSSTPAASLGVLPTLPAEEITMAGVLQPGGSSWETPNWSDAQPASVSAAQKPGSTYRVLPSGGLNSRLRSPEGPRTAVFPGNLLTIDGSGVFTNNPGAAGVTSEIRFKQPIPGLVVFPKLVMNGGQLDAGNDGIVEVGGLIEIRANTPIYSDSGNDRGFLISAQLTGAANIEYRGYNQTAFNSNYVNNLNIACSSNTFTGKWNVVLGTLLGTASNCLGTNDIIIGANGALETTYDINSPNAIVSLAGRMYLHQNHTFKTLFVNGVPLGVGTYTFAQLNATYPANFPATWMPQAGATNFTTGSGSIKVLVQPAPTIVQQPVSVSKYPTETVQFSVLVEGNPPLYYQWRKGGVKLTDGGNTYGSTTNTLVITNITTANAGDYQVVVTNSIGSVTSIVATLTVLPTGPAQNLTLDFGGTPIIQPQGADWDTVTNWSDGLPASLSAVANPGSTYRVVAGARLRTPANAAYAAFPGDVLTVDGDGLWVNNGSTTIGEIRFKHPNPATNYFKRLVMNGGQLDSGDNGLMVIAGRMDVLANTPIYADSGAGQDRPFQIDAQLTGNGGIELHQFGATFAGNLNVTGTGNTFSGLWNIVQGCVLGSGLNSLGTNHITVGLTGALETLYDINNPLGNLVLDGQMFLHQNDRFHGVTVAGVPLAVGTYTFATLNRDYPLNFPATWPLQLGSGISTGSGSITVLGDAPPEVTIGFGFSGGNLTLTWSQGTLLQADTPDAPAANWTPVPGATPPSFTITPGPGNKFFRVQVR